MIKSGELSILSPLWQVRSKWRAFAILIALYLGALAISYFNLVRLYPDETTPFLDISFLSLGFGFMSLPLSAMHLMTGVGDGIIPVAGRPNLFLFEIVSSSVFLALQVYAVWRRSVVALGLIAVYLGVAAPYWGFYSGALMGI